MVRIFLFALFLTISSVSALAFRSAPTQKEIDDLTKQIAEEPGNSRWLQNRGLDYAILGEKDKALADYKAAQKVSPRQLYLYWSYGWALFDLGEYASAIQVWKSAAMMAEDRKPSGIGRGWSLYTLALGYWGAGDKDQAFLYLTEAAKLHAEFRYRDTFEAYTDRWTQKEQTMALQLFDAWQKEVEKLESHLW
jgi:tetratricopeptide (TPR) repeat protein